METCRMCEQLKASINDSLPNDARRTLLETAREAQRAEREDGPWHLDVAEVRRQGQSQLGSVPADDPLRGALEESALAELLGWQLQYSNRAEGAAERAWELYDRAIPPAPEHWLELELIEPRANDRWRPPAWTEANAPAWQHDLVGMAAVALLCPQPFLEWVTSTALSPKERAPRSTPSPAQENLLRLAVVAPKNLAPEVVPGIAIVLAQAGLASALTHPDWQTHLIYRMEKELIHVRNLRHKPDAASTHKLRAAQDEVLELVDQAGSTLCDALPALLATEDEEHLKVVAHAALKNAALLDGLKRLGHRSRLAAGLHSSLSRGEISTLLSTYAWWLDHEMYAAPQSLTAPSATWLNDTALENEIRARADSAASRLSNHGISDEVEVTGALVQMLVDRFTSPSHPVRKSGREQPPLRLEMTSTNSQTHEKVSGADIGIVVRIDVAPWLHSTIGHLVQVKQANNRETATDPANWPIDTAQLQTILSHDPSATYWLLQLHHEPKVLVLPAKYLLGLSRERSRFTAHYQAVRSAAVPLGNHLVDLVLGLWVGSADPGVVGVAEGNDSRHQPAQVLTIHVASEG